MINTITVKFIDSCYYLDNGNIRKQVVKNLASGLWYDYIYTYTYDLANRLTNAVCNRSQYSETYSYDTDGNIMSRMGSTSNPTINYSYTGGTNRLAQVTQSSVNYSFAYDAKGNMITDNYSGVTGITYDRRNLPLSMTKGTETYTYRYNDKGERTRKVMGTANEYYLHDHTGHELAVWDKSTNTLKMVNLFGAGMLGRVEINGTTYSTYYYIKDHLGSIRQTLNSSGNVVSGQDYYPYGALIRSYDNSDPNGKYKFTEKERDALTNYDYFGARYYISKLGRWMTADPMAAKYPGWSSYNYCLNNPVNYFDPNGDTVNVDPNLLKPIVDKNGKNKKREDMTAEEKHRADFQEWWNKNEDGIEKLFGIGGKYETTTINFNLGTMPYPEPTLSNLFNLFAPSEIIYNGYDALTTFGTHTTEAGSFNRGGSATGPLSINKGDLEFNVWFNPKVKRVNDNAASHEWEHVCIIFNKVKNGAKIPSGAEQHKIMQKGNVPKIQ